MSRNKFSLAIHGGAGARLGVDYSVQTEHIQSLLEQGAEQLGSGDTAVDVVVRLVAEMESSGLYVAGKGSSANRNGQVELDASLMCGSHKNCGAVAALQGFESPISVARGVMEDTEHVLLVGLGAEEFARSHGYAPVLDPVQYYSLPEARRLSSLERPVAKHGTVGAVVMDGFGELAAATSTGGTYDKMRGRVGDSPMVGAGTWTDARVAVSCTGYGEAFVRAGAAKDVADRMHYGGESLSSATGSTLEEVARLGGDGGIIAVDASGQVTLQFNSDGMKCGYVTDAVAPVTGVFEKLSVK